MPVKRLIFTGNYVYTVPFTLFMLTSRLPPSISLLWYRSITFDTFWKVAKYSNFYCNIKLLSKKFAKRKSARNLIIFRLLRSLYHGELKFKKLNLYSRKTENMQTLFVGICAKICATFLRKNCTICFLWLLAFQSRNPMTRSRSKYRFSRVKVNEAFRHYAWELRK